jgi:hypothetical protein
MEGMQEGPGPGSDGVEGHIRGDRGTWRSIVVVGFVVSSEGECEEECFMVWSGRRDGGEVGEMSGDTPVVTPLLARG